MAQAGAAARPPSALKPTQQPSAFVQIAANGEVTVTINRLEFGQGVQTALPMILAEELDADWSLVRSRHGTNDAAYVDPLFGIHLTGGSNSIKNSFTQYRELGARARAMLLGAAAARWNVDVATLRTQAGTVLGPGRPQAGYGELAEAAMALPVPEKVTLKDPKDFRIIGRPTPRLDARAKSSGRQDFGIDMRLPGQLTAVVARPPVFGARLASVDDSAARAVKGVKAVLRVPLDGGAEGVAVVADGYWQATQGRDALKLQWDTSAVEKVDSEKQLAQYRELAGRPGPRKFDADMAPLATAPRKLEAEFVFPYLAHAAMEPLNCTVQLSDGRAEIWMGSQCPGLDAGAAARVLGLKPEQVAVHVQMAGGGFGRRFSSSERHCRRGLRDRQGRARRRPERAGAHAVEPRGRHEGRLLPPDASAPRAHRLRRTRQGAGLGPRHRRPVHHRGHRVRAVPGEGRHRRHGDGGHARSLSAADAPDRASSQAQRAGAVVAQRGLHPHRLRDGDPARRDRAQRPSRTRSPTACSCSATSTRAIAPRLQLAVDKSGYGKTHLPAGRAWGVAVHESFDSVVAYVVEASVQDGRPVLHRVTAGVHCNLAVNPRTVEAQVQGAAIMGLSMCLPGSAITLKDGVVEQGNFGDFTVARITDMPEFDVHIVPSAEPPTGMGEPGLPPLAPAFANAIARLTGKPLRQLPFNLG